ncbi:hypothetical protein [Burkholderia glumae]|uniref:hypothetical protein n=1 Tax=Burkholderia glumae TaxID=337 RepID=UPI001F35F722|nr:hypothetical protein [Burkholderia glumae]
MLVQVERPGVSVEMRYCDIRRNFTLANQRRPLQENDMKPAIDIETLTKDERSMMLYAESCCVDYSGLLEACRMNNEDMAALRRFQEAGLLTFGRVPANLLGQLASYGRKPTHW